MNQIAEILIAFGESQKRSQTKDSPNLFSENSEADKLCHELSYAFLLACLAAGGMRAEKIWEFPFLFFKRINNIGLMLFGSSEEIEDLYYKSISQKPALHRFPKVMTNNIMALDQILKNKYKSDPSNIWESKDAQVIQQNLLEIRGFGPKKAAMTVELLHRFLGIEITNLNQGNVAADTHVIRTLNRLGLTKDKSQKSAMAVARNLFPEDPGLLDFPLWKIGKTYCKSKNPNHQDCPLKSVCPEVTNL